MPKKIFGSVVTMVVSLVLLWGVVRAATSRYNEQRDAIINQCDAEQDRLGLSEDALRAKYPTPELTFCRFTRVLPGGSAEVVTRGKFQAGTKFLFDNDQIELVKEALAVGTGQKESEYRATIKVAQSAGPDYAGTLSSFQPVRCITTRCLAVYIGGKYEWEFAANNGWRLKLTTVSEPTTGGEEEMAAVYRSEFYRRGETKPFEVREVRVGGKPSGYSSTISESGGNIAGIQAEMAKLSQKMADMNLSERERDQLMKRYEEVNAKYMRELEKTQQELEKQQEFGCRSMNFRLTEGGVEGTIGCGEKVGSLQLKGTMKYLGP